MVVVPVATAVPTPVLAPTVTKLALPEVHTDEVVRTSLTPLCVVPVAVNELAAFAAVKVYGLGVTAIDTTSSVPVVESVTVKVAALLTTTPLNPGALAVMFVTPVQATPFTQPVAVAKPALAPPVTMVATWVPLEAQVTSLVISLVPAAWPGWV
jgi:hypothetical protein